MCMNRENLVTRDEDPLVKSFNDLYAVAKLSSALSRTSLRHAYLEGLKENRIAWFHRATDEVISEAMDGYNDEDIHRFFNRY